MPRAGPYAKLTREQRDEIMIDLADEWSHDWEGGIGRETDGAMLWRVNAVDVMLFVNEVLRLRGDLATVLAMMSQQQK